MTRLASTLWASVAFGLMTTSTALAQSAPETTTDDDTTTTTTEGDTTTTTTTTTTDEDVDMPPPTTDDTTTSGTTTTPMDTDDPVDVDVDVDAPPPPDIDVQPQPTYVSTPTPVVIDDDDDDIELFSGIGVAIAAGGGAGGFVEDNLRDTAEVGGDWDVRATIGTRSPLAFEASYIGSAQAIDALGLDNDALLIGNGLQGALRLNATTDTVVQPFLFAGLGWRHYELDNDGANLSDVNDDDDVLEIPLGVGIAGRWRGLMLDARGEFRGSSNEDLVPERGDDDEIELDDDSFSAMHRWGVKATVGFEF